MIKTWEMKIDGPHGVVRCGEILGAQVELRRSEMKRGREEGELKVWCDADTAGKIQEIIAEFVFLTNQ